MSDRIYDFNTYLRNLYAERVQKITIDAGFTCPNRDGTRSTGGCIFCNQKGSGTGQALAGLSVREQILRQQQSISQRYKARKFLAYFQSFSNTYAPLQTLKRLYEEALSVEGVVGLCIGTRPDCIDSGIVDLLESYAQDHLVWLELGLQSFHDQTLHRINRGHGTREFLDAVNLANSRKGINICVHVILGLPGEEKSDMIDTACKLSQLAIHGIKIHLLYVIKGTPLAALYQRGEYCCLTREEYIDILCEFIQYLPSDMVIQRLISDPHPDELLAPAWALNGSENRRKIEQALAERDIRQGQKWKETSQGQKRGGGSVEGFANRSRDGPA
ncbi:MAG: TIGR01212 family radical SAM protein [bacterium]